MWPFKKQWAYWITLPKIDPKEAAAIYLNDLGKRLQVPRKGWRFLFLDFRESDASYKARLEPALKATWRQPSQLKIEEGIKTLKDRPLPAGKLDAIKAEIMARVNPKYIEEHMGGEIENPNYDPNMTFEQAQELAKQQYLIRKG